MVNKIYTKGIKAIVLIGVLVISVAALAQADEWMPVTGAEKLSNFMSGITVERKLPNGEISRGEYHADGTGTLYSWGASIPRTWEVKGDNQICVTAKRITNCYQFERNTADKALYRARDVATCKMTEFRVVDNDAVVKDEQMNRRLQMPLMRCIINGTIS